MIYWKFEGFCDEKTKGQDRRVRCVCGAVVDCALDRDPGERVKGRRDVLGYIVDGLGHCRRFGSLS